MVLPNGPKVPCSVVSVWADRARKGVTKTTRLPPARHLRMQSSAIRVLPALVGSDTTKSSACRLRGPLLRSAKAKDRSPLLDGTRAGDEKLSQRRPLRRFSSCGLTGSRSWNARSHRSKGGGSRPGATTIGAGDSVRCRHPGLPQAVERLFDKGGSPRSRAIRKIDMAAKKLSVSAKSIPSKMKMGCPGHHRP